MKGSSGVFVRRLWHWFIYGDWYGNNINSGYHKHFHKVVIYRLLGAVTVVYVGLWLFLYHRGLYEIPYELRFFWALTLLGYILLKEVYRWTRILIANQWGEIFAWLVIVAFTWMNVANLYYKIKYGIPFQRLPDGAFEGACEAFVLLVGSNISSALEYRRNGTKAKPKTCGE